MSYLSRRDVGSNDTNSGQRDCEGASVQQQKSLCKLNAQGSSLFLCVADALQIGLKFRKSYLNLGNFPGNVRRVLVLVPGFDRSLGQNRPPLDASITKPDGLFCSPLLSSPTLSLSLGNPLAGFCAQRPFASFPRNPVSRARRTKGQTRSCGIVYCIWFLYVVWRVSAEKRG